MKEGWDRYVLNGCSPGVISIDISDITLSSGYFFVGIFGESTEYPRGVNDNTGYYEAYYYSGDSKVPVEIYQIWLEK